VYRIDWNGAATPIGEEGALGWPAVTRIVWEPETGRLYGFDGQFNAWLQIDPITGRAVKISDGAFPNVHQLHGHAGFVYAVAQGVGRVDRVAPDTGQVQTIRASSGCHGSVQFLTDVVGTDDGFVCLNSSIGLLFYRSPQWTEFSLGGSARPQVLMAYVTADDALLNIHVQSPTLDGTPVKAYEVNRTTGNETLYHEMMAEIPIGSLTYVPSNSPPPLPLPCTAMDADADEDIDLRDYAAFQTCFSAAE